MTSLTVESIKKFAELAKTYEQPEAYAFFSETTIRSQWDSLRLMPNFCSFKTVDECIASIKQGNVLFEGAKLTILDEVAVQDSILNP